MVRSSGVDESIESRGLLESYESLQTEISARIPELQRNLESRSGQRSGTVNWVVQELAPTFAKGHLSNERRLSKDKRDWVAEVEASSSDVAEVHRVAIRTWRDARRREEQQLRCPYRANYINRLEDVARWAYERLLRVHFEWVWDGRTIYVVQADECDQVRKGERPEELVQVPNRKTTILPRLNAFRLASPADFEIYRKLSNARLYRQIGYKIPDFYVLDDPAEIRLVLQKEHCSDALEGDLETLTCRPLVIRTDGVDIPPDRRQMLPRSDELRSSEAAKQWLLDDFRAQINDEELESRGLCLVAHHFIPATASAWCQAHPEHRRVRIESLWGIPEGLYWYAYDAFDVDTLVSTLPPEQRRPGKMLVRERIRFKERFIAPDSTGAWVLHYSAAGPDWQRSIQRTEWIEEIAWTSRRIAHAAGKPTVVMWLIDIPSEVSPHRVMPWHHEDWKHEGSLFKAAPRKKLSISTELLLQTRHDWMTLQSKASEGGPIARVVVAPSEPELVRDQQFAKALGALAKEKHFVVELSGGILSHAYYMLSREGCEVECTDLDEYATEDERLEFNKLVRDKIPDNIVARGENVALLRLEGEALIAALQRKLVEEALEVVDARTTAQIVEELADLREVMLSLVSRLDISDELIEQARRKKAKSRGSFHDALMLSKTTIAPPLSLGDLSTDNALGEVPRRIDRTISRVAEIPSLPSDVHVDKRHDQHGTLERQFTMILPVHAYGFTPSQTHFTLDTQDGTAHEMVLEVLLEREGPDLRCKLRLINTPTQLDLPLSKENKE